MPNKHPRTQRKQNKQRSHAKISYPMPYASGNSGVEQKIYSNLQTNFQLYHNLGFPYFNNQSLLDGITTGIGANARIGNKIFVNDIDVLMVLNNKADRPNVTYRVVFVAAPATVSTDAYTELFSGGGITGVFLPTAAKLLHDATFPNNQGGTQFVAATGTKERSHFHQVKLRINAPVIYSPSDQVCQTRIVGWVVAYDSFGTLTTDNIASIATTSYRVTFTDE